MHFMSLRNYCPRCNNRLTIRKYSGNFTI